MNRKVLILAGLLLLVVWISSLTGEAPQPAPVNLPVPGANTPGDITADPSNPGNPNPTNTGETNANKSRPIPEISEDKKVELRSEPGETINIEEKLFVNWVLEIYSNPTAYIGRQVRIQGMLAKYYSEEEKKMYHYVYRIGPGCCGNDGGMCGFEFSHSGDFGKDNDWVEVVGTLELKDMGQYDYPYLKTKSVSIKSERGLENVQHQM